MKKRVYFVQAQDSFDNNMYLPYSSGILWAYASQYKDVTDNYQLAEIVYEKLPLAENLAKIVDPYIVFFSTYGWNTRYHLMLAEMVHTKYPNAKIVFGGPNVHQSEKFFSDNPYVTIACWGEGENTITELLQQYNSDLPDLSMPGISYMQDGKFIKTAQRERIKDLNEIPSPYLTGVFDHIIDSKKYNYLPLWETNRGCPYHCTFCDLGADYYNKMYQFDTQRLLDELNYFSRKQIEYIEILDTNFGIYERDLELAIRIKTLNQEVGFPKKINATWAKNSPARVLEMAKVLFNIDRGGVTLALQSQDPTTLKNVKRINIANSKLYELIQLYNENNIPTYHDFILGLPGETVESWKIGINQVIDYGTKGWLFAHPLEAYLNTEMGDPEYQKKFGIKTYRTAEFDYFVTPNENLPIEYGDYVMETDTMTLEGWMDSYMYVWLISSLYYLGFLQYTVHRVSSQFSLPKSEVFLKMEQWILNTDNIVRSERELTKKLMEEPLKNDGRWGRQMFGSRDVLWLYDSASAIVYQQNFDLFYKQAQQMLVDVFGDSVFAEDCIAEQKKAVKRFTDTPDKFKDFCRKNYWWGRKVGEWKTDYVPKL